MIYTPEQEAKIDTLLTELNTQSEALEASKGTPKEPIIRADLTDTIKRLNVALLDVADPDTVTGYVNIKHQFNQVTNKTNI